MIEELSGKENNYVINGINIANYFPNNYGTNRVNKKENVNVQQMPFYSESNGYHLRIGESENEAIAATGFSDDSSLSIFKSDEYSSQTSIMLVKYWDKDGKLTESKVNAKEVSPDNASYMEMLALSSYYNVEGKSTDSIDSIMTSNIGLDGTIRNESYNSLNQWQTLKQNR